MSSPQPYLTPSLPADDSPESLSLLDKVLSQPQQIKVSPYPYLMLGKILAVHSQEYLVQVPTIATEPLNISLSMCSLTSADINKTCVIQFVNGDLSQPLISGLLAEVQVEIKAEQLAEKNLTITQQNGITLIEAAEQLVLKCGQSRIVMTADGVITIRGLYIDNHARATQRIRGGSVRVN